MSDILISNTIYKKSASQRLLESGEKYSDVVLVIEDDVAAAEELIEAFDSQGVQAVHAMDSEQALILAQAVRPSYILVDVNLPGKDGIETIADIRRLQPDAQFIAMTGDMDRCDGLSVGVNGVDAILQKPLPLFGVVRYIRTRQQEVY